MSPSKPNPKPDDQKPIPVTRLVLYAIGLGIGAYLLIDGSHHDEEILQLVGGGVIAAALVAMGWRYKHPTQ